MVRSGYSCFTRIQVFCNVPTLLSKNSLIIEICIVVRLPKVRIRFTLILYSLADIVVKIASSGPDRVWPICCLNKISEGFSTTVSNKVVILNTDIHFTDSVRNIESGISHHCLLYCCFLLVLCASNFNILSWWFQWL